MNYKGIIKKTKILPAGTPLSYNTMKDTQKLGIESIKGLDTKTYRLNERH
jgi:hypothetical protein